MAITLTCPACAQQCAVADEHAGKAVSCPKCNAVINVPPMAAAAAEAAPIPGDPTAAPEPPLYSSPQTGIDLRRSLEDFFRAVALDPLAKTLFLVGVGCLAAMLLFTFLPWISTSLTSPLGIQLASGVFQFLLTAGVLAFLAYVVLGRQAKLFDLSLWIAAGFAALAALWRLINLLSFAGRLSAVLDVHPGVGLILSLVAALGAAGTLGFIIFQRLMRKA